MERKPQMIAVDTNVLLRYIVDDNPDQLARAGAFFRARSAEAPVFVSLIVLVELTSVLKRLYGYSSDQINGVLLALMETSELVFEEEDHIAALIRERRDIKADLADHLIAHVARKAGCSHTVTFDKKAAAQVAGMELLA